MFMILFFNTGQNSKSNLAAVNDVTISDVFFLRMIYRANVRRTDVCVCQEVWNTSEGDNQLESALRLHARHHGPDDMWTQREQDVTEVGAPESCSKFVYWRQIKVFVLRNNVVILCACIIGNFYIWIYVKLTAQYDLRYRLLILLINYQYCWNISFFHGTYYPIKKIDFWFLVNTEYVRFQIG